MNVSEHSRAQFCNAVRFSKIAGVTDAHVGRSFWEAFGHSGLRRKKDHVVRRSEEERRDSPITTVCLLVVDNVRGGGDAAKGGGFNEDE